MGLWMGREEIIISNLSGNHTLVRTGRALGTRELMRDCFQIVVDLETVATF